VHPASDVDALVRLIADPFTAVVTLTITEKGYSAGNDPAESAPARLALGLKARREAGVEEPIALLSCDNLSGHGDVLREGGSAAPGGLARVRRARREAGVEEPIALLSCDNLSGNGDVLREAVLAAADEETRAWFDDHVDVISTMVDRITPSAGEQEGRLVAERTGLADQVPVVTEPFTEWVVQDTFRGRRPAWEKAGVQFTDDVELHELRKLRLLNGSHTLM